MIKLVDAKINKIKNESTLVSIKFEDKDISKEQYKFLKNQLYKFKLYINKEYSMKFDTQYDKLLKLFLIDLDVIIPNYLIPKDPEKSTETIMEPIMVFQLFYEAQNQISKKNHSINSLWEELIVFRSIWSLIIPINNYW